MEKGATVDQPTTKNQEKKRPRIREDEPTASTGPSRKTKGADQDVTKIDYATKTKQRVPAHLARHSAKHFETKSKPAPPTSLHSWDRQHPNFKTSYWHHLTGL